VSDAAGPAEKKIGVMIGRRVRALRQKAKLNQEDIAFAIGSTQPHFAKIEKGEVNVGSDMLQRIADAMKVDISQFFDLRHDMPLDALRPELDAMLDTANEEQLRLIFRIVDAIIH